MSADEASLRALTDLLTEFYCTSVKPDRRQAIQEILIRFEQTELACHCALYYLQHTSNCFVVCYCLGIIEKVAVDQWPNLNEEYQTEVRLYLRQLLFHGTYSTDVSFVSRKLSKVLAIIACFQWPRMYPEFFDDIISQIRTGLMNSNLMGVAHGLIVLQTAVSELFNPLENVVYGRGQELKAMLHLHSYELYAVLVEVVNSLCGNSLIDVASRSLMTSDTNTLMHAARNFACYLTADHASFALRCQPLLSWLECLDECLLAMSLDTEFHVSFYYTLYALSVMVLPANLPHQEPRSLEMVNRISVSALSCIHNIIDRKDLSLDLMCKHLFYVFPIVHSHLKLTSIPTCVSSVPSEYRTKLIDLLQSLMNNFFNRVTELASTQQTAVPFNPERFLSDLQQFTFSTFNLKYYPRCLNIWSSYFEFLHVRYLSHPVKGTDAILPTGLCDVIIAFGERLLSNLFYSDSTVITTHLDSLGDDEPDDLPNSFCPTVNCEEEDKYLSIFFPALSPKPSHKLTERCIFYRESLQVFGNAMGLAPVELSRVALDRYDRAWREYATVVRSSDSLRESASSPATRHSLCRITRDYATSVQSLGFVLEHVKFESLSFNLVHTLLVSLQLGSKIVSDVHTLTDPALRLNLTDAVVQSLVTVNAMFVSGYLDSDNSQSSGFENVVNSGLSFRQRYQFAMEIFFTLRGLIIPAAYSHQSIPLPVQLSGALLFKTLCTCLLPVIDLCHPSLNRTDSTCVRQFFLDLLDLLCRQDIHSSLHPSVTRLLLQTFFYCLSIHRKYQVTRDCTDDVFQTKTRSLNRCLSDVFVPHLTMDELKQNQARYLGYLGLLNESLLVLESVNSDARHFLHSAVTGCHLLDSLVACTELVLSSYRDYPSTGALQFCTAHLTFFTTFVRILSHSSSTVCNIPALLSRIIRVMYSVTDHYSNECQEVSVDTLEHLIDILLLVSKNRSVCMSIASELLDLCLLRFLPSLGTGQSNVKSGDHELIMMVCDAATHNSHATERFFELLFSLLENAFGFFFKFKNGNYNESFHNSSYQTPLAERYHLDNPDAFHRILQTILAVFHECQPVSSLVRLVLEHLATLHRLRKFYGLPAFNRTWLPEIARLLLNRLVDRQHESCKDDLLVSLHQLVLSGVVDTSQLSSQGTKTSLFISQFLPAYLSSLQFLTDSQRASLASAFLEPTDINSRADSPFDLTDFDLFKKEIERLTINLRCFRRLNCNGSCAVQLFGDVSS